MAKFKIYNCKNLINKVFVAKKDYSSLSAGFGHEIKINKGDCFKIVEGFYICHSLNPLEFNEDFDDDENNNWFNPKCLTFRDDLKNMGLNKVFFDHYLIFEKPKRIISAQMRFNILKDQCWRCNNCGCQLKFSKKSNWDGCICHIDHIWPFANAMNYPNGIENINERSNLQALCPKCNQEKWKRKN